jgi:hypothetical protein
MRYFFIYSAGGGAGDWNGLKRVWNNSMPVILKQNILLKFGDVYFNHSPKSNSTPLVKPVIWKRITNLRNWISSAVNDLYVQNSSNILLDSGTSKIVNYIVTLHNNFSETQIINEFLRLVNSNGIIQKYVNVINTSNINEAVTFDLPNPFKVRTQSSNTRTNVFTAASSARLIIESANYCNQLYTLLGNSQQKLLTTINGTWSSAEISRFNNLLIYRPDKIAVGGLTRLNRPAFLAAIQVINSVYNLSTLSRVHFLGCGGIENVSLLKSLNLNLPNISVDNSTPYNRAIDGNKGGTKHSGYFDYSNYTLHRINSSTAQAILVLHNQYANAHFSPMVMQTILQGIINHGLQSAYDDRAKLAIHNNDVFRQNAI